MEELKDIQKELFLAIKKDDIRLAGSILSDHPELTNLNRIADWLDDWDETVTTPLILASGRGNAEMVKTLLQNGADVKVTGTIMFSQIFSLSGPVIHHCDTWGGFGACDGFFPLFAAVGFMEGREAIKPLLSAGADVNQRTNKGQTVLHIACTNYDILVHGIPEFSLDDDDAGINGDTYAVQTLIDHGADVNICNDFGKSPLHYAAENGNRYSAQILIRKGANVYLKDKLGFTPLDYASSSDYLLTKALIDKYDFQMKQIIEAYEFVASKAPSPLEVLRKATILREQHGIPKNVLPALECYGYEKEWETIEELEKFGDTSSLLSLACLLSRERISIERNREIASSDMTRDLLKYSELPENKSRKHRFNSLLSHWIDLFSYFKLYLDIVDRIIMGRLSLMRAVMYKDSLSSDVLVKFVVVAIDSCCVFRNKLKSASKPGCAKELINDMEQTIAMIGIVVMQLIKRIDKGLSYEHDQEFKSEVNYEIATILLEELFHQCPTVSAPYYSYSSPATNVLYKGKYKPSHFSDKHDQHFKYSYHMMKIIVQSQCDLNATDCQGNTILHVVISDFLQEINAMASYGDIIMKQMADTAENIIKLLLDNGAYPHAKNKQGKCPGDGLQNARFFRLKKTNYLTRFEDLISRYDCTLTLKYLTATKIVNSRIPYKDHLPEALIKFVDLH